MSRLNRERQREYLEALDRLPDLSAASGGGDILLQIYNGGAMPSSVPGVYLGHPVSPAWDETAGSTPSLSVDSSKSFAVLMLGKAPSAGDMVVAHDIGGRWAAETNRPRSSPAEPCAYCGICNWSGDIDISWDDCPWDKVWGSIPDSDYYDHPTDMVASGSGTLTMVPLVHDDTEQYNVPQKQWRGTTGFRGRNMPNIGYPHPGTYNGRFTWTFQCENLTVQTEFQNDDGSWSPLSGYVDFGTSYYNVYLALKPTVASGLTVHVGAAAPVGDVSVFPGGNFTLAPDTTTYIYADNITVRTSTSGWPEDLLQKIAVVVTNDTEVTSLEDVRTFNHWNSEDFPSPSCDPPVAAFSYTFVELENSDSWPSPVLTGSAGPSLFCKAIKVVTQCGFTPPNYLLKVYGESGGLLITYQNMNRALVIIGWYGTGSVRFDITAPHFQDFSGTFDFPESDQNTANAQVLTVEPVDGEWTCQSFKPVCCSGLPVSDSITYTITDNSLLTTYFSGARGGGTGPLSWVGSGDVHVALSGTSMSRYASYSQDLSLVSGRTTALVLTPASGYYCIASIAPPVASTLHASHSLFGSFTMNYDGTGSHGVGWYAVISYSYPGYGCCPAVTVTVTCFLSTDGNYIEYWRST